MSDGDDDAIDLMTRLGGATKRLGEVGLDVLTGRDRDLSRRRIPGTRSYEDRAAIAAQNARRMHEKQRATEAARAAATKKRPRGIELGG